MSESWEQVTPEQRSARLEQVIIGLGPARIESRGQFQATVVTGQRVNHLLHFIIGLLTCGVWWLAWALMAFSGGESRVSYMVDEYGRAYRSRGGAWEPLPT